MKTPYSFLFSLLCTLLLATTVSAKVVWTDVPAADLASKTSSTGSDLEILLSKSVLTSDADSSWTVNYIEAKVYTKKGLEETSILHFEYLKHDKIWDVGARVVKADGTKIDLAKKDFIESTALKTSGVDLKKTSFAFPNLAEGDIVEYQWKQGQGDQKYSISWNWYYCQSNVPTRDFEFDVVNSQIDFSVMWFNCPTAEVKKGDRSSMILHIKNIPAFVEEPDMPPERDFRGWICLLFTTPYLRLYSNIELWDTIGSQRAEEFRMDTGANEAIKSTVKTLVANAKTPEEQLSILNQYCQDEIVNFDWFKTAETMEARDKRNAKDDNQTAGETFKMRTGNSADVNRLFAAMARSLKFEVREAISANREDIFNVRMEKGWIFMNRNSVAVKIGETWKFYTPSEYGAPAGMLSLRDEAVTMYVCDEKKSWYETSPVAAPELTFVNRKARLTIDADGTLDGEIEVQLNGHAGVATKKQWWGELESEAVKSEQERIAARIPGVELSEMHFTNLGNNVLPVVLKYKVHAPGYAEAAGTRLVFSPNFFEVGRSARFPNETRKFPIFFPYASTIRDDIEIVFPEGYTLDAPTAPSNVGDPKGIISAQYGVGYKSKARVLIYKRNEVCGKGGNIAFRQESYPAIKHLYDEIDRSDHHSFILKPVPVATSAPAPSSTATPATPAAK